MPTHGHLTKAGRVRTNTPKVDKTAVHLPTSPRKTRRRQVSKAVKEGLIEIPGHKDTPTKRRGYSRSGGNRRNRRRRR